MDYVISQATGQDVAKIEVLEFIMIEVLETEYIEPVRNVQVDAYTTPYGIGGGLGRRSCSVIREIDVEYTVIVSREVFRTA
jgi:hypothetical protein